MKRAFTAIVLALLSLATVHAGELPVGALDDVARAITKLFTSKTPQEVSSLRPGVTALQRAEANRLLATAQRAAAESEARTAEESAARAARIARLQRSIWQYHVDQITTAAEQLRRQVAEQGGEASAEFFFSATCTSALNTLGGYQPLSKAEVVSLAFSLGVNSVIADPNMQRAISLAAEWYFLPDEPTAEEQDRARRVAHACEEVLKI